MIVRKQAVAVFVEAFPLIDISMSRPEQESSISRQCQLALELLKDPSHNVRAVTIKGVCKMMAVFWEIIPSIMIKHYFSEMINSLSRDVS